MKTVLALDVGRKRIGIAVGEGSFAFPHATLERTNVRDDVARIVAMARERGARTIVVGDPLTMRGERALASEKIDAFVAHLARAFDGAIERIDERLTTAGTPPSVSRAGRALLAVTVATVIATGVIVAAAATWFRNAVYVDRELPAR